jgi:hypothetical protein
MAPPVLGMGIGYGPDLLCEVELAPLCRRELAAPLERRQTSAEEVRDNLAEVMRELLTPLYERFSFFQLSPQLVTEELARMGSGRF